MSPGYTASGYAVILKAGVLFLSLWGSERRGAAGGKRSRRPRSSLVAGGMDQSKSWRKCSPAPLGHGGAVRPNRAYGSRQGTTAAPETAVVGIGVSAAAPGTVGVCTCPGRWLLTGAYALEPLAVLIFLGGGMSFSS